MFTDNKLEIVVQRHICRLVALALEPDNPFVFLQEVLDLLVCVPRLQAGSNQLICLVKKLDSVQFRISFTILHHNASDLRGF